MVRGYEQAKQNLPPCERGCYLTTGRSENLQVADESPHPEADQGLTCKSLKLFHCHCLIHSQKKEKGCWRAKRIVKPQI